MKRIAASLGAALLVCALAWICGFNFNERGPEAGLVAYLAIFAAVFTYLYQSRNR